MITLIKHHVLPLTHQSDHDSSPRCESGEDIHILDLLLRYCLADPVCSEEDLRDAKETAARIRWVEIWGDKI